MSYKLTAAEKAKIQQDVLDEFKEKEELKKHLGGWEDIDKIYQKRLADRKYKAKLAALKKEGKLTFKDLMRFR